MLSLHCMLPFYASMFDSHIKERKRKMGLKFGEVLILLCKQNAHRVCQVRWHLKPLTSTIKCLGYVNGALGTLVIYSMSNLAVKSSFTVKLYFSFIVRIKVSRSSVSHTFSILAVVLLMRNSQLQFSQVFSAHVPVWGRCLAGVHDVVLFWTSSNLLNSLPVPTSFLHFEMVQFPSPAWMCHSASEHTAQIVKKRSLLLLLVELFSIQMKARWVCR